MFDYEVDSFIHCANNLVNDMNRAGFHCFLHPFTKVGVGLPRDVPVDCITL